MTAASCARRTELGVPLDTRSGSDADNVGFEVHFLDDLYIGDGCVAVVDSQVVCVLVWQAHEWAELWDVVLVWTAPGHRGRGIATRLVQFAARDRPLRHSDARTDEAEEWSKGTGLPRPERKSRPSNLGTSGPYAAGLAARRLGLVVADAESST